MKKLGILLLIMFNQIMFSQNLDEFRNLIKSAEKSEQAAKTLIEKSTVAHKNTNEPIFRGFLAVGNFFMAKHVFNPLKKMSYFKEGKNNLENAVNADPKNIEIRMMRLITQENIPRILGYNQHIKEDREFLIKEYQKAENPVLKNYIKEYLKI